MIILNDFDTSVRKALEEIEPKYNDLEALVVCGSHDPNNVEGMIEAIKTAREAGVPFLGICHGHQLAAIEYARNVLNIKDATSEEFSETGPFVVVKLPELKVGLHDGQTYWNNYEVHPSIEKQWVKANNFFTSQYHPEYQSSKDAPHPLLVDFINACKKKN